MKTNKDPSHVRAAPGVEVGRCGYRPEKGILKVAHSPGTATCPACKAPRTGAEKARAALVNRAMRRRDAGEPLSRKAAP
jgi:hypothetical protein